MKKLTILFLSFVTLLFVGVFSQPAFAADELVDLEIQVVSVGNLEGTTGFSGVYGELVDVTFSGLEGYAYHIYNGEVFTETSTQFINSKSTYVAAVDTEVTSVVYIDTNGRVVDALFGAEIGVEVPAEPSKPG